MIDIKVLSKKKDKVSSASGGGNIGGANTGKIDEAKHAISADEATHAEQAEYADRAGYTSRAAYADVAGDIAEDSPVNDRFLSKTTEDTAQEIIHFEKGLTAGTYEKGVSGASINEECDSELNNLLVRGIAKIQGDTEFGDSSVIKKSGDATLGNVSLESVRSKGYTESDRTLIGGNGFELYKDNSGKSHLYVDNAVIRCKLLAAETEVRKISYSGGTMVLSNAGSTIVRVVGLDAEGREVVASADAKAFKCWASADDGTTRTMNWWKAGDMAMCKTFNVKGSNRYYWRLVIARGQ